MKRIAPYLSLILLLVLSACSAAEDDALSQTEVTIPSETVKPSEDESSEETTLSPRVKPTKKSTKEAIADGAEAVAKPGSYLSLQEYRESKEIHAKADVVLFFNANWCSTCKIARDNIESSLDSIPSNLVIVVVDFDSEIDLRKEHGVTIQHTFVQIDQNGNQLAKWAGSVTVAQIAEKTV